MQNQVTHTILTTPHGLMPVPDSHLGESVMPRARVIQTKTYLHLSGYDPRAAGGRQTLRLALPPDFAPESQNLELRLRSDLLPMKVSQYRFLRASSGEWQAVVISFSSRYKEHGQYPLEIEIRQPAHELHRQRWACTTVLFVPRSDASLSEIHGVFLATQKNVRVIAEDGAIAKLQDLSYEHAPAHRQLNIEVLAKDAALAHMDFRQGRGPFEIALGSLAWDEELLALNFEEEDQAKLANKSEAPSSSAEIPHQAIKENITAASLELVYGQRHLAIKVLALKEFVIGRAVQFGEGRACADMLLRQADGTNGLHRRISAKHAILLRTASSVSLVDISRYGVLLDGVRVEKEQPMPLREGSEIELCASFRGIAVLRVVRILPHALLIQRLNAEPEQSSSDASVREEWFYLLTPETKPTATDAILHKPPQALPLLFHHEGQIWQRELTGVGDKKWHAIKKHTGVDVNDSID